jgi:hypothetical protein
VTSFMLVSRFRISRWMFIIPKAMQFEKIVVGRS